MMGMEADELNKAISELMPGEPWKSYMVMQNVKIARLAEVCRHITMQNPDGANEWVDAAQDMARRALDD